MPGCSFLASVPSKVGGVVGIQACAGGMVCVGVTAVCWCRSWCSRPRSWFRRSCASSLATRPQNQVMMVAAAAPLVSLIVCASPVHQSSRTLGPPMIRSWWGQDVQASAFTVMRCTTPSRSATAVARAGNSVAGSRVRGHHPPPTTSSAVGDSEKASRTSGCMAATRG
jgi:hypothetical protein